MAEGTSEEALEAAAQALASGTSAQEVFGATFLAGVQGLHPGPVGNHFHAVMMVESACQMAEGMAAPSARRAALWTLDDFRRAREVERRQGNWTLGDPPEASYADEATARKDFVAAMEDWDRDRADAAMVGLLRFHTRASLFEIVWPYVGRSMVDIGHKVIFGAHVERMIARMGWEYAEPPLRSLARGLVHAPGARNRMTSAYERSLALREELPSTWSEGTEDPEKSAEVLGRMRSASPTEAQRLVVDAFADGLGPQTVWDGLRLFAAELFLRRTSSGPHDGIAILPLHAVTETNAFGSIARISTRDATRRLMVLQAAAWLADTRLACQRRVGLSMNGPGFDEIATSVDEPASALATVLEEGVPSAALAHLRDAPRRQEAYVAALHELVPRKAQESHQFKYAAALAEEARHAHPRWRAHLLAPALPYLPLPTAAPARGDEAIRRALAGRGS